MASLIHGYEYDIFISYRQNDNKHDRWVTDFVNNLKGELESTFKEEISVYYDENPHDGLLETHDVAASLTEKLKCLVFIPILSRTYCDVRSFAWKHEFEAFVNMALQDRFGLKIRLPNGNVVSRVLPVRIHSLDPSDSTLFSSVTGGAIRGIDFIYMASGVNRPLLPKEEKPQENLNNTNYRDQVNKLGNALNDMISAMVLSSGNNNQVVNEASSGSPPSVRRRRAPFVAGIVMLLALVSAIIFLPGVFKSKKELEKSIAVLPLRYDSPADTNQIHMNALMGNILTHLQEIRDLSPRSRTSSEKFRNTSKTIPEIAGELRVNYIVESVGRISGNIIHLNVTLYRTDKRRETRLWGRLYNKEIRDAIDIFSLESQLTTDIAEELEAVITPAEKQRIEKAPTSDLAAYEDYLVGQSYLKRFFNQDLNTAMKYFEQAKDKDPGYARAYVGISKAWVMRALSSYTSIQEATTMALTAFNKALELDTALAEVYVCRSWIQHFLLYDSHGAEISCKKALSLNPNDPEARRSYANVLVTLGRLKEATEQIEIAMNLDPLGLDSKGPYCVILFCSERYEEALTAFREFLKINPENGPVLGNYALALHMAGEHSEALKVWESFFTSFFKDNANMFKNRDNQLKYVEILNLQGDSLAANLKTSYINPTEIAQIYACAENKDRTLDMLEYAFREHDPNLPYILRFPIFDFLSDEARFQILFKTLNLPVKEIN
jgi:TolB-like protein/Flp pilus assembly protein TadD